MDRIISETPDKWVVVRLKQYKDPTYKVFASWMGGYLDGDRWKMNSGINKIEEDKDHYYFTGHSGSCYKCHKKGYGFATSFSRGILQGLPKEAVELLSEDKAIKYINQQLNE